MLRAASAQRRADGKAAFYPPEHIPLPDGKDRRNRRSGFERLRYPALCDDDLPDSGTGRRMMMVPRCNIIKTGKVGKM